MPTYRVELAKTARSGCQNKECKIANVKLEKGELRFGNLVELAGKAEGHSSWSWKHWGCVTPYQIEQWREMSGGDMEMIDGYDELPAELQEKIERSLEQGHVDDADWRGDPEVNRDGGKRHRMTVVQLREKEKGETQAAAAGDVAAPSDRDNAEPQTNKPAAGSKKRRRQAVDDYEDTDEEVPTSGSKKRGRQLVEDDEESDKEVPTPAKKSKTSAKKGGKKQANEDNDHEEEEAAKKAAKKTSTSTTSRRGKKEQGASVKAKPLAKAKASAKEDVAPVKARGRSKNKQLASEDTDEDEAAPPKAKTKAKAKGRAKKNKEQPVIEENDEDD